MKKDLLTSLMLIVLAACASLNVSDDALTKRTAQALSMNADDFTISSRIDEGDRTDYQIRTDSGRRYDCSVTGSLGIVGRSLSDATCSEHSRTLASRRKPRADS